MGITFYIHQCLCLQKTERRIYKEDEQRFCFVCCLCSQYWRRSDAHWHTAKSHFTGTGRQVSKSSKLNNRENFVHHNLTLAFIISLVLFFLNRLYSSRLSEADSGITFAKWMGFGLPLSIIVLLLSWIWLQIMFLGFS